MTYRCRSRSSSAFWKSSNRFFGSSTRDSYGLAPESRGALSYVEADQDALGVGQGADDLLDRLGEFPDQRRDGNDLVLPGELGILLEVDDLDLVLAFQVLLANP